MSTRLVLFLSAFQYFTIHPPGTAEHAIEGESAGSLHTCCLEDKNQGSGSESVILEFSPSFWAAAFSLLSKHKK